MTLARLISTLVFQPGPRIPEKSAHTAKENVVAARWLSWPGCRAASLSSGVSQNVCPFRHMGGEVSWNGLGRALVHGRGPVPEAHRTGVAPVSGGRAPS